MLQQPQAPLFDPHEQSAYETRRTQTYLQDVDLDEHKHRDNKKTPAGLRQRAKEVLGRLRSPADKPADIDDDDGYCPPSVALWIPYLVAGVHHRTCARWTARIAAVVLASIIFGLVFVTVYYAFYCPECYTCLSQAREAGDGAVCPHSMVTKNGRVMICSAKDGTVWVEPRIVAVDDTKILETEEVFSTAAKCPTTHYYAFRYTSIQVSAVDALTGIYRERMPFGGIDAVCMQHILYKRVLGHGCRPVATFVVNGDNKPKGFAEFKGRVIQ